MSLIPCCDLYADHKPCRCAFEARPFRVQRRFTINGAATVEEGAIVKIHSNGAVFVPDRGPFHMPQIRGAVTQGWLVAIEGDPENDKKWTRSETSGRYALIDEEWLD